MKIEPVQKHQNSNLSVDKAKNKNITFTSSYIQEFNKEAELFNKDERFKARIFKSKT